MLYESEFLMTALIFGPPIGAPGGGPGALREHPGSVPREGARPTGPIGIPYKSQKGSSVNRNIQ